MMTVFTAEESRGTRVLCIPGRRKPESIELDIRNVNRDTVKVATVSKSFRLAYQPDSQSVAEGIESQREIDRVREHGASRLQGYRNCADFPVMR